MFKSQNLHLYIFWGTLYKGSRRGPGGGPERNMISQHVGLTHALWQSDIAIEQIILLGFKAFVNEHVL